MLTHITKHTGGRQANVDTQDGPRGSLDTNVILRLILNDIAAQHTAATELIEKSRNQFAVADTAIIEVAFVLSRNYGFTRPAIRETLENLLSLPQINTNRALFDKALPMYVSHAGLSLEDCCLHAYAELNDATPLWTFDKKLASQAEHAALVA